jgi:hypothetical protein
VATQRLEAQIAQTATIRGRPLGNSKFLLQQLDDTLRRNSLARTVPQNPGQCHKHCSGDERLDLHGVNKVDRAFDQALFLLVSGTVNEVIAAEVLVHRSSLSM